MDTALLELQARVMHLVAFWPVLLLIPAYTLGRVIWRDIQTQKRITERYRRI